MKHFLVSILVLFIGPLCVAMDSSSWCRALIADYADVPAETRSPIELWLQSMRVRSPRAIDQKHQLAWVVPVYSEFGNGNLERLLARLHNQDVLPHQQRIVLVVNNTPAVARERTPAFLENQATLKYLRDVFPLRTPVGPAGSSLVEARHLPNGTKLDILDYSSQGTPQVIGQIRQNGVQHVFETHRGDLRNLIVHQFDADSLPSRMHTSTVLEKFSDPRIDSVLSFMDFRLPKGSSAELHATHFRLRGAFGRYDRDLARFFKSTMGGGPRIATRGSLLQAVHGVPILATSEDFQLIQNLDSFVDPHAQWRFPVQTSDRARLDGYDCADRAEGLDASLRALSEAPEFHQTELGFIEGHLEVLEKILPNEELKLLREEVSFWREQALVDLTHGRAQDPFWETLGSTRFASLPTELKVNWTDLTIRGTEVSVPIRLSYLNRALARFYGIAREYPAFFPGAVREARKTELRQRFLHGKNSANLAFAARNRFTASMILATESMTEVGAFQIGSEITLDAYMRNIGREKWVEYLLGSWQQAIDEYGLNPAQERRLVQNSRYLIQAALLNLNGSSRDPRLAEFVRKKIVEYRDRPRAIALLLEGFRPLARPGSLEMDLFAMETIEVHLRERLKYLMQPLEKAGF